MQSTTQFFIRVSISEGFFCQELNLFRGSTVFDKVIQIKVYQQAAPQEGCDPNCGGNCGNDGPMDADYETVD